MSRIKIQLNKFRRRIKRASVSQLKEILVLLSSRLNKSRSLSSKKRIKAKIIITQMAIRGRVGNPSGLIGGPASWTNAAGPSQQRLHLICKMGIINLGVNFYVTDY